MKEKMDNIKSAALDMIAKASTSQQLADVRVKYLGKSGEISLLMRDMANVPKEERPNMGKMVNELRNAVESVLNSPRECVQTRHASSSYAHHARTYRHIYRHGLFGCGRSGN